MMHQRQPGISIVGLGCSSFSNFFDVGGDDDALTQESDAVLSAKDPLSLTSSHPRVQGWIETVRYAVLEAGITVLDTAPWYGHGTSEVVVGLALQSILSERSRDDRDRSDDGTDATPTIQRSDLTINTKVGRYEADPKYQFDFSREVTLRSIQRSLERLQVSYVDVLQLHDPEFAPSLDALMEETIPAMIEIQERGWCRTLGMTGYPLHVQRQILDRTFRAFERNVWDQSLVYSHYNLHDTSLWYPPTSARRGQPNDDDDDESGMVDASSFAAYCRSHHIRVMTAAPLSMGLLTTAGPPAWHPASDDLHTACRTAAQICDRHGVDVSELALLFALSHPAVSCTIVGMKSVPQVQAAERAAARIASVCSSRSQGEEDDVSCCDDILGRVLSESERDAYVALRDPVDGPFAHVWKDGTYQWDGVQCARDFWKHQVGIEQEPWHAAADET
jgi:L-galactose dehydrogenase